MKRLTPVALAGLAAALAACGSSSDNSASDRNSCPRNAGRDASYSGKFEGAVSMDETEHLLRVTRNGRPVSGARVCVNTQMVGMSSMHYTAKGNELAPGRYQVGFKFGMEGGYRGNVVAKQGGTEVSIPVSGKVGSAGKRSGGMDMAHGGMEACRG